MTEALLVALLAVGCGASAPLGSDAGRDAAVAAPDAGGASRDALDAPAAEVQMTDAADAPDVADDGTTCCPIDPYPTSCLHGGGSNENGCFSVCDFWCAINWRIELDAKGCPAWRMDYRQPAPGENQLCEPDPDAGRDAPAEE